jgi:hypothetical protein
MGLSTCLLVILMAIHKNNKIDLQRHIVSSHIRIVNLIKEVINQPQISKERCQLLENDS